MSWLTRWRDRTFLREVAGVILVGMGIPENQRPRCLVGGTKNLSARMTDSAGYHPMKYTTAPTFGYESSDEAIATVDSAGTVTAVYTGSADTTVDITVTATLSDAREFEDTVTVDVIGDVVAASVDVSPATVTLAASATQQLTVAIKNAAGSTIAGLTPTSYTTSDAGKATVSAGGLITAVATGSATITAHYNALTDTCVVTVS